MKSFLITMALCLTTALSVGQNNKEIIDTSSYYYTSNQPLLNKLRLKNLESSSDQSVFRFWKFGQVIEITKNDQTIDGKLINYIFRQNRKGKRKDTIFEEKAISDHQIKRVLHLVDSLSINTIPTDTEIEEWTQGLDGVVYFIEHATPNKYSFKSYWTPNSQKDFDESIRIKAFIDELNKTLSLSQSFRTFREGLPHSGCYQASSMTNMCYASPGISLFYDGFTKLPLGGSFSLYTGPIGELGVTGHARFNKDKDHDYGLRLGKQFVLNKQSQNKKFLITSYEYRGRELNFIEENQNS